MPKVFGSKRARPNWAKRGVIRQDPTASLAKIWASRLIGDQSKPGRRSLPKFKQVWRTWSLPLGDKKKPRRRTKTCSFLMIWYMWETRKSSSVSMVWAISTKRWRLRGMSSVLKEIPKGFLKSAVTAYQSARPPMVAAPPIWKRSPPQRSCRQG